jgi:hypothetical protein
LYWRFNGNSVATDRQRSVATELPLNLQYNLVLRVTSFFVVTEIPIFVSKYLFTMDRRQRPPPKSNPGEIGLSPVVQYFLVVGISLSMYFLIEYLYVDNKNFN